MDLRRRIALAVGGILLAALVTVTLTAAPETARLDPEKIAQAAGTKATTAPDGVVRIAWARTNRQRRPGRGGRLLRELT